MRFKKNSDINMVSMRTVSLRNEEKITNNTSETLTPIYFCLSIPLIRLNAPKGKAKMSQ